MIIRSARGLLSLLVLCSLYACAPKSQALFLHKPTVKFVHTQRWLSDATVSATDTTPTVHPLPALPSNSITNRFVPYDAPGNGLPEQVNTKSVPSQSGAIKRDQRTKQVNQVHVMKHSKAGPTRTSGLAITSFLSGIISASIMAWFVTSRGFGALLNGGKIAIGANVLVVLGAVSGIIALVTGIRMLAKAKKNPALKGRGFAIIGLLIGAIAALLLSIVALA